MKAIFLIRSAGLYFMAFLLILGGCQEDLDNVDPDDENNAANFSADQLSEFLVLDGASKIVQNLKGAPDGKLKISVKDTMYVVKGLQYGARVAIKHNGTQEIRGIYIGVSGSSFYYDAPASAEGQDSTETIYIHLEIPGNANYPLTVPIKIQPYGPDGEPLDEFERWITIEDPDDEDVCDPTVTQTCTNREGQLICNSPWSWVWEATLTENLSGDIHTAYAPALFQNQNAFQHGGCCWNGISIPAKYDPYCVSGNPEYFEVTVDDAYYVRYFEFMDLFDNGKFERYMRSANKIYVPDSSNYCSGVAGYFVDDNFTLYQGEHDFTPGADNIRLTTQSGGSGWAMNGGELIYTCHSLIISFGREERYIVIYRRFSGDIDEIETYLPEFYE